MSMKSQLRLHLLSLFGFFFIVYFAFMIYFTQMQYINKVTYEVEGQFEQILSDRLKYSTESVSTTIYMTDKIGIEQILRLAEIYNRAKVTDPYPIDKDAYSLYDQDNLSGSKKIYNAGVTCNGPMPAGEDALKQLQNIWE